MKKNGRCLITGASGLLGEALVERFADEWDVEGWSQSRPVTHRRVSTERVPLTDAPCIRKGLDRFRPDVIVHAAAWTNVDGCEVDPEKARTINVLPARILAEWIRDHGRDSRLLFISTDSVFDGSRGRYQETDSVSPLNVYANNKVEAENILRDVIPNRHAILRTNFFGFNAGSTKPSLAEFLLKALFEKQPFTLFKDVFFSPLWTKDLSDLIEDVAIKKLSGTFHVGSRERYSKEDFGLTLAKVFGLSTAHASIASVDTFSFRARRPKDSSLNSAFLEKKLGRPMPSIEAGLVGFYKSLKMSNDDRRPAWLQTLLATPR